MQQGVYCGHGQASEAPMQVWLGPGTSKALSADAESAITRQRRRIQEISLRTQLAKARHSSPQAAVRAIQPCVLSLPCQRKP